MYARVYAFERVCKLTGGTYTVADGPERLRSLIMAQVAPLPSLPLAPDTKPPPFTRMGFPPLVPLDQQPCACHLTPLREGYVCTQCGVTICQLPCSCPVCGITLVSAPHLARSYHHLFHVPVAALASTERYRWLRSGTAAKEAALVADKEAAAAKVAADAAAASAAARGLKPPKVDAFNAKAAATNYIRATLSRPAFDASAHDTTPVTAAEQCERLICGGCDAPLALAPEAAVQWAQQTLDAEEAREKARMTGRAIAEELRDPASLPADRAWWRHVDLASLCVVCGCVLCVDCDGLVHTSLHNCPGCLSVPH
jgi:hypothetical protein